MKDVVPTVNLTLASGQMVDFFFYVASHCGLANMWMISREAVECSGDTGRRSRAAKSSVMSAIYI